MRVLAALAALCCLLLALLDLLDASPVPDPQLPLDPRVELAEHARKQPAGSQEPRIRRLSVGQPYTIQQKHHHYKQRPLLAGDVTSRAPHTPAAVRQRPDVTGPVTGAVTGGSVTERVGESIIRVPVRRKATGCRYYQRIDVMGRCRDRW